MTREEAIERFENVKANALVQKASGVSEYWQNEIDGTVEAIDMAIEALSAETVSHEDTVTLNSPITISAVQGEWEFVDNEIFAGEYFCSICGKRAEVDLYGEWILSNYCPSCGARMKGGAE